MATPILDQPVSNSIATPADSTVSTTANSTTKTLHLSVLAQRLWCSPHSLRWLLFFTVLMLFAFLGARELWTQEWRWADISLNMMLRGDYFHPYLGGTPYYDKPLLSYWLMIAFAHLLQGMSEWSMRLPAALAGVLAVFCIYRIGSSVISKPAGLIAGWMLITTFYFVFWARTANTDMLNVAGILLAVMWYFVRRERPGFLSYSVFFLILAVSALFKGLIAVVIPLLVILPDLFIAQSWKKHLRLSVLFALIPAAIVYVLPFWLSSHVGSQHYAESGLYLVYRENILRYLQPFDHQDPIYSYLLYLPAYMFPWILFFIPALFALYKRWSTMSVGSRWTVWSTALIFLFLTVSGSRRNYYVLPLVPFAILMTADWIAAGLRNYTKRIRVTAFATALSFILLFIYNAVLIPIYYSDGGLRPFAQQVQKQVASNGLAWSNTRFVFLDAENKLILYLQPSKAVTILAIPDATATEKARSRTSYSSAELLKLWPQLLTTKTKITDNAKEKLTTNSKATDPSKENTIFITRRLYLAKLRPYFSGYSVVLARPTLGQRLLHCDDSFAPVAFIP